MKEQLKILKKQATALEKTTAPKPAPAPAERPAPPDSIASRTRSRVGSDLNKQLDLEDARKTIAEIQPIREKLNIALSDSAVPNVPLQEKYLSGRRTTYVNQLNQRNRQFERILRNPNLTELERRPILQAIEENKILIQEAQEAKSSRISKTLTTEVNTSVSTPANDNLRATQPTRELESRLRPANAPEIEMRPVGRNYFPEIAEIVQAAMQQMGSRRPLQRGVRIEPTAPSTAGTARIG
jgi:hypothetical protein